MTERHDVASSVWQVQFEFPGLAPDYADYVETWELQRRIHGEVVQGSRGNTVLLLEHAPVYTAGKRTQPHERPLDGTPVVDVDRGGKITWHGPGQIVGYPIVRLPTPVDVVAYVRVVEQMMIDVAAHFGVQATRVDGRSGAWILADERGPDRKVGAIGIRVSRRVTMHGFALNCDNEIGWADAIIPCGIPDAGVTTLSRETGRHIGVAEVMAVVQERLLVHLGEFLDDEAT